MHKESVLDVCASDDQYLQVSNCSGLQVAFCFFQSSKINLKWIEYRLLNIPSDSRDFRFHLKFAKRIVPSYGPEVTSVGSIYGMDSSRPWLGVGGRRKPNTSERVPRSSRETEKSQ